MIGLKNALAVGSRTVAEKTVIPQVWMSSVSGFSAESESGTQYVTLHTKILPEISD